MKIKEKTWIIYNNEPWYVFRIGDKIQCLNYSKGQTDSILIDIDDYPLIVLPKFNIGDQVITDYPEYKGQIKKVINIVPDDYYLPYRVGDDENFIHTTPFSITKIDL